MPDDVLTPERTVEEYKSGVKPTWCPGCGDFGVLNAVYNSLRAKGYAPQDVVLVSGNGGLLSTHSTLVLSPLAS